MHVSFSFYNPNDVHLICFPSHINRQASPDFDAHWIGYSSSLFSFSPFPQGGELPLQPCREPKCKREINLNHGDRLEFKWRMPPAPLVASAYALRCQVTRRKVDENAETLADDQRFRRVHIVLQTRPLNHVIPMQQVETL